MHRIRVRSTYCHCNNKVYFVWPYYKLGWIASLGFEHMLHWKVEYGISHSGNQRMSLLLQFAAAAGAETSNNKDSVLVCVYIYKVKLECSRYRPGVAQMLGRGIALLFYDHGTRSGWVVSSTPRPHFTSGKDPAPILQEAGWAPGPVWTGGKSRPHRDSIPGPSSP